MRRIFLLIAALLVFGGATAQSDKTAKLGDADAQSIRAIIEAQLAAFAADDADKAFSFASDFIREKFTNPATFLAMVKRSYPVVYRPASVSFTRPAEMDGQILQSVEMADVTGRLWQAMYNMQRQPDHSWRINGCVLQPIKGSRT
jgi:hypothetical protein